MCQTDFGLAEKRKIRIGQFVEAVKSARGMSSTDDPDRTRHFLAYHLQTLPHHLHFT
jgi:hypothetical protein